MATLNGFDVHTIHKLFSITPVTPAPDGPRDAYDITLSPDDKGQTLSVRGNVHGWQLDHYYFERIASAFAKVAELPGKTQGISICGSKEEPTVIYLNAVWIHILVWSGQSDYTMNRINVNIFLLDEFYRERTGEKRFLEWGLSTTVEEARKFGDELMQELNEAKRLRRELRIETEWDTLENN